MGGVGIGLGLLSMVGSQAYSSTKKSRVLDNIPSNPIPKSFRSRVSMSDLKLGRDYLAEKDDTYGVKLHITPAGRRRMSSVLKSTLKAEARGDFSKADMIADATPIRGARLGGDLKEMYQDAPAGALPFIMAQAKKTKASPYLGAQEAYDAGIKDFRNTRDSNFKKGVLTAQNKVASSPGGGLIGNTSYTLGSPVQTRKKKLLGGAG